MLITLDEVSDSDFEDYEQYEKIFYIIQIILSSLFLISYIILPKENRNDTLKYLFHFTINLNIYNISSLLLYYLPYSDYELNYIIVNILLTLTFFQFGVYFWLLILSINIHSVVINRKFLMSESKLNQI